MTRPATFDSPLSQRPNASILRSSQGSLSSTSPKPLPVLIAYVSRRRATALHVCRGEPLLVLFATQALQLTTRDAKSERPRVVHRHKGLASIAASERKNGVSVKSVPSTFRGLSSASSTSPTSSDTSSDTSSETSSDTPSDTSAIPPRISYPGEAPGASSSKHSAKHSAKRAHRPAAESGAQLSHYDGSVEANVDDRPFQLRPMARQEGSSVLKPIEKAPSGKPYMRYFGELIHPICAVHVTYTNKHRQRPELHHARRLGHQGKVRISVRVSRSRLPSRL